VTSSPVDTSELRQVAAASRGDRAARHALFERYRDTAYRVAMRITGRSEDALDVVQDSYIRAFERIDQFRGSATASDAGDEPMPTGFKPWLLRIVANRALDLVRARKVRLAMSLEGSSGDAYEPPDRGTEPAPSARLERAELRQRVQDALNRLPPDQHAVIALYATGDMTYGQIAEALGIPIGTVMSRLYHARRRLAEWLPDLAGERAG